MEHDITHYAKHRYTAKVYNPDHIISDDNIEKIKTLLQLSPSSFNWQPWHFLLAASSQGKARIAKAAEKAYPKNTQPILDASHVLVLCSLSGVQEAHLQRVLEQEYQDKRFANEQIYKERLEMGRKMLAGMRQHTPQDLQNWMAKQVYLNLGQLLLGVATLGIDATPMEGVDTDLLDNELNLTEKGLKSVVVVTLGYHNKDKDNNAKRPKSRLPLEQLFTDL